MPFTYWSGPIVGQSVSHVWQGYAAVLFLEFGKLSPAEYTLRDGRPGEPRGEFGLTTMESFAAWKILLHGKEITTTTSDAQFRHSARFLKRLIGRRLQTFAIDAASLSTRLNFSNGLMLMTNNLREPARRLPHWLLQLPNTRADAWSSVVVGGTRSMQRCNED
jgi:hypothetical protein